MQSIKFVPHIQLRAHQSNGGSTSFGFFAVIFCFFWWLFSLHFLPFFLHFPSFSPPTILVFDCILPNDITDTDQPSAMIFCHGCGEEVVGLWHFCANCGTRITDLFTAARSNRPASTSGGSSAALSQSQSRQNNSNNANGIERSSIVQHQPRPMSFGDFRKSRPAGTRHMKPSKPNITSVKVRRN